MTAVVDGPWPELRSSVNGVVQARRAYTGGEGPASSVGSKCKQRLCRMFWQPAEFISDVGWLHFNFSTTWVVPSGDPGEGMGAIEDMERRSADRYLFHSEDECDRLEMQAAIAGIEGHLRYMRIPDRAHVLDAGCGSGSMSRLLARRHPDATILGLDLNPDYVTYARELAQKEKLANVSFQEGSVQALPFAAATFDLVWSKHVLFFVPSPEEAITEFRRVTKPGGSVLIVLEDWHGLVLDGKDEELRQSLLALFGRLAKIDVTSRLPTIMMQAGLIDVSVHIEASTVYTIIGSVDPQRRRNHDIEMLAARSQVVNVLGSEAACDDFYKNWFAYLDRPDTCTILPIWFVQGTVPS